MIQIDGLLLWQEVTPLAWRAMTKDYVCVGHLRAFEHEKKMGWYWEQEELRRLSHEAVAQISLKQKTLPKPRWRT